MAKCNQLTTLPFKALTFANRMWAHDVHQHENVVFDGWSAVISNHRLVHDHQSLNESLETDWPRSPSPPPRSRSRRRRRPAPIWPAPVDDRRRPPFVLIVGGRWPDGSRSSVIAAARVRRVPATVVVCTSAQHRLRWWCAVDWTDFQISDITLELHWRQRIIHRCLTRELPGSIYSHPIRGVIPWKILLPLTKHC